MNRIISNMKHQWLERIGGYFDCTHCNLRVHEGRTFQAHRDKPCPKRKLQLDPAGRTCPDCVEQLGEVIPPDSNGTCHGCGSCFGKATQ